MPVIYAAPGVYKYTVTGIGITPSGPFTATVAGTGGGDAMRAQPNTFTAANTFTQQITSTVATGTAPFSIASTTVVSNLNAQLHNGKTAPSGNIVGDTDTQTLTNKTIDISANTLKNSSNTAGHVPRNNGTQYVDAQLGFADLSGTASTSQIGTGTPAASKYVDGGTGAWTTLPAGGIPVTQVDLTAQGANIAATTILTPGANGFYRVSGYSVVSRAATTSSTNPGVFINYTDADSGAAETPAAFISSNTANVLGSVSSCNGGTVSWCGMLIYAKSGVAIQYSTTGYASSGATSMQYALHLRL
ncbi:MAG TPA: hypothetical protein VJN64_08990, partial [Terriglobales bacterium]|nr:hypothetical protein [Terriglobales bacterium]